MSGVRALLLVSLMVAGCGRLGFDPVAGAGDAKSADATIPADAPFSLVGPGQWTPTSASPLAPVLWTTATWTGAEFMVFGGAVDGAYNATNAGARYDPVTNLWRPTAITGAPSARHSVMLGWSGTEVLAYGGAVNTGVIGGGGAYDPVADTWRSMATTNAPGPRTYAVNLWIGDRWLLWGGYAGSGNGGHRADGALYDPATDQWTPMSMVGAPSPRSLLDAVWTGSDVIVWGGCDGAMPTCAGLKGDGAIYTPATDSWRAMSQIGAPSARSELRAVWTGTEMIVFGGATAGNSGAPVNDGARYDPLTDTWTPLSTVNAPTPRAAFAAAWMTDKLAVWGSLLGANDGFLYDPTADQWSSVATAGAPTSRGRFAFAASERVLFVWGGSPLDGSGAIWSPE